MASRAEIRLSVVSLCYRHGEGVADVLAKARIIEDWLYREDKATDAIAPPSASEGDQSSGPIAPASEAGQATPSNNRNTQRRS
jgi:hypothetical protein